MAATAARPTPPPPVHSYPLPSPSKKDIALKPNPHPYAIKTTSTALLTRSNSSGYNVNATHHYYIPTSPNHSRSDSGKGHRASKSFSLVPDSPSRESPRPLPVPPSLESPTRRDGSNGSSGGYVSADEAGTAPLPPPRRPRRSSTLPVIPVPSPIVAPAPSVDDLPDNPKLWTPSQLAIYLATALRMTSIGKPGEIEPIGLPALVAKDIAAFVKGARIGGRTFLRLNEEDLEGLGMNKKWRDALLTAARNLRQNVLKGRIWGADGSPATSPSPQSTSPPKLFSNPELNSSSSSIESYASGEDEVASGAALGRSKARRYRNGHVRGMIESYERSGSFSSDGGLEDSEGGPGEERAKLLTWSRQQESPSPSRRRPLPVPPSPSGSHSSRLAADEEPTVEALLAELAPGARAWEEMDIAAGVTVKRVPEGQATIQPIQLDTIAEGSIGHKTVTHLGSGRSSGGSSKGKGERRIVTAIFAPSPSAPSSPTKSALKALEASVADGLETFAADAGASPVSSPGRQQKSRPLPPTPADDGAAPAPATAPEAKLERAEAQAQSHPDFEGEREREAAALESMRIERMLEEEILATRALLDTFCARLEIVEHKVAVLEAKESTRAREEEDDASLRAALVSASALGAAETSAPATQTQTQTQGASVEIGVQSSAAAAVADAQVQSDSPELASKHSVDDAGQKTSSSALLVPPAKGPPPPADALSSSTGFQLQSVIPEVVRRLHAPAGTFFGTREDGDEEDEAGRRQPANVSDLPSYVFLVGLGVCAVVIQVVLRRVVGKGSGLRP